MSKVGIRINIDVTKIDKSALYEGKKGKYLELTTFVDLDEKDQYDNNGFVSQGLGKEREQGGEKGAILGNVKVFWKDQSLTAPPAQADDLDDSDTIPF